MAGDYGARILEVDLSRRQSKVTIVDPGITSAFIGGRGLGAYLLWTGSPKNADPLDESAPVYILAGPLTGLGGAQTAFVFKSPLTRMTLGHSVVGGHFGTELRQAGYDGLAIRGRADDPVYLRIDDGSVTFCDARGLWGKGTIQTENEIKSLLGDPRARVASIGPAGENGVAFASVQHEYFHSAARGGAGTVLGSKNLKAIVVRGRSEIPVADPAAFGPVWRGVMDKLRAARTGTRRGYSLARWGSTISFLPHTDIGELDVRNYREGSWDEIDKVSGLEYESRHRVKSRGCFGCPIGCMQVGVIRDPRFDPRATCPDFDSTGTIGPGCLVSDLSEMLYLNQFGDDMGFDNISLGNVTGFAMECYEKGILTREALDGIDLKWGNTQAMLALWNKILKREGIGDLLARGVREASREIGGGSERFAMQVKGSEFGGYTPQAHPDRALQYAVGDRGACHHFGLTRQEQNHRAWADSLVVCSWHEPFVSREDYVSLINSVTGWGLEPGEWDATADRILMLSRAYNIREGADPVTEEVLPERVHKDALTMGPKKGAVYPIEDFLRDRAEWYRSRGCDERGIPTAQHLRELGLDLAIQEMDLARECI